MSAIIPKVEDFYARSKEIAAKEKRKLESRSSNAGRLGSFVHFFPSTPKMSESQPQAKSGEPVQAQVKVHLPPRSTPSPDNGEAELKSSRKREREVSLEPATPTASGDADPLARARKHSGLPLKKNRRALDPTAEENEADTSGGGRGSGSRSASGSPPDLNSMLTSPRQEMRRQVRQISQGVEDISWRGPDSASLPEPTDVEIEDATGLEPALVIEEAHSIDAASINGNINGTHQEQKKVPDEETPPKTPDEPTLSRSVEDIKHVDIDVTMHPSSQDRNSEGGDDNVNLQVSSEADAKGLKRKFLDRGTSQGPENEGEVEEKEAPSEALKRPRDDSDKDDNPRETKKPSPPPSPPVSTGPPSPKANKPLAGFMAYASTSSPFAAVKGQNVFSPSKSASPSPFGATPPPPTPLSNLGSSLGASGSSTPNPPKRSGFEAFSSTSSPFASFARSKSPVLGVTNRLGRAKSPSRSRASPALTSNAFASYAGSSSGFALPAQKRARAASPGEGSGSSSIERSAPVPSVLDANEGVKNAVNKNEEDEDEEDEGNTFGARLRAAKDEQEEEDEQKMQFTEQEVATGEEDEETIHQVRGKLFTLQGNGWKEKGTGLLKLNIRQEDGSGARLVMRKDAVYTLLLNVTLFRGMRCSIAQDPRYIRFGVIEDGVATTYNLKVSNAKIAQDLLDDINTNIPS